MKMSKATDYALVLLARLEDLPKDQWVSVRTVADEVGIPSRFLSNIVHRLVQAGILTSHRGVTGGVQLAKPSEEITIGAVLEATDDSLGLVDCVDEPGSCPLESHCNVQKFWSVTHTFILTALKHITLKEITSYLKDTNAMPQWMKKQIQGEDNVNVTQNR